MKKILAFLATVVCIFALCGCSSNYYKSAEDITIAKINEKTMPITMAEYKGAVTIEQEAVWDLGNGDTSGFVTTIKYVDAKNEIKYSQMRTDGEITEKYYTSSEISTMYEYYDGVYSSYELYDYIRNSIFESSFTGYPDNATIKSATKDGKTYVVVISIPVEYYDEDYEYEETVTLDAKSGYVLSTYQGEEDGQYPYYIKTTFTYSNDKTIDNSPEVNCTPETDPLIDSKLSFTTNDINGNTVTESELTAGAKLIMVNFWEPWCSPCVNEMPDLQKLYEKYADEGLVIIGVYTTEEGAKDIIEKKGITYPIIELTASLYDYTSDYVPTTVFFEGNGNYIGNSQEIGAKSYEEWESIITTNLYRAG